MNLNFRMGVIWIFCALWCFLALAIAPTLGPLGVSGVALLILNAIAATMAGIGLYDLIVKEFLFGGAVHGSLSVERSSRQGAAPAESVQRVEVGLADLTEVQLNRARTLFPGLHAEEPYRYVIENGEVHHRVGVHASCGK